MLTSISGTLRTIGTSMYGGGTKYTNESTYRLDIMAIMRSEHTTNIHCGKILRKTKIIYTDRGDIKYDTK